MGMPGVIGRCVALAVTAVVVWPAAAQGQKVLHGETSLGRPVNLTLGDDGRPAKLTFAWRVPCSGGGAPARPPPGGPPPRPAATVTFAWRVPCSGGGTLRDATVVRPSPGSATTARFRSRGSYRIRQRGGYRIVVRLHVRGHRIDSAAWGGLIDVAAVARRHGKLLARCGLRDLEWTAGRLAAPPPKPTPPPPPGPPPSGPPLECCANESPRAGAWKVTTHSDPGDPLGFGSLPDHSYGPPRDTLSINASRESVGFNASGPDDPGVYGRLWAPSGQNLAVGGYQNVQERPSPDHAGLSLASNGRGCTHTSGSFTVTDLAYDATGTLQTLKVTFEQHCDGSVPALHGTLEFHAASGRAATRVSTSMVTGATKRGDRQHDPMRDEEASR